MGTLEAETSQWQSSACFQDKAGEQGRTDRGRTSKPQALQRTVLLSWHVADRQGDKMGMRLVGLRDDVSEARVVERARRVWWWWW